MKPLAFDRIVTVSEGLEEPMSLSAFRSMDLHRRVRLILDDRIRFLSGNVRVPTQVALQSIADATRRSSD